MILYSALTILSVSIYLVTKQDGWQLKNRLKLAASPWVILLIAVILGI